MKNLYLVSPTIEYKESYFDLVQEYEDFKERIHPGILRLKDKTYEEWLQLLDSYKRKETCPTDVVPSHTYFLVDDLKRIYGAIQIRHYLNEKLFKFDGHLGAGVRPSERRKGYASLMLQEALKKCREMGLEKVLITCNYDNTASYHTIIANGGIFENEMTEPHGNVVKRFWIDLNDAK